MSEILLSICIPTYNRYFYLKRLLESLLPQLAYFKDKVEVVISDNASLDKTIHLCDEYAKRYPFFRYSQNSKNEGPDYNIHNAFDHAKGRYVWIVGDDEVVINNAIGNVFSLLEIYEPNFIFLNSVSGSVDKLVKLDSINYLVTDNNEKFSRLIGVYSTFISACIINKSVLVASELYEGNEYKKLLGSYLVQLSWVLPSLLHGGIYIFVQTPLIIAQQDNSGGYKYVTVFSANFLGIIKSYYKEGSSLYNSFLLSALLHLYHFQYNTEMSNYVSENSTFLMKRAFSSSYLYRYVISPFGKMRLSYLLIMNITRIRRFFLKITLKKRKIDSMIS
ncbi:hypothetical protein SOASR030_11100 [Leminorella grimontii]|uniref:Glycosyltransferase 2-like domain-containing protein n=1 Tax=Leminorella grimontii TaxID=82981 RepID=A0AAV5N294_9GAMM|nr:glycosyltransferase family 2 protein [Leminorella grimontii]KFC97639.1 family 2 glycosyltransferase [Leminorella grimontii ATCC 33999 = DSM 5078]GKX54998.1 hypothetical protein SOASR030_11100 [Leminorella grimontii]VFS57078.1 putative glycosyl transferase [Leminorella grimontii]